MKTGRNQACPCGSGKKYKQCCGEPPPILDPQAIARSRLRRATVDLAPQLMKFITESYGADAILEAWAEFTLWSEEPFDPESPQATLFYPWFFHIWSPEPRDTEVPARCLHAVPPTQAYLIAKGKSVDPLLSRYLSACLDSPFGFHEVVGADGSAGLRLREVLTDGACEVFERGAAGSLKAGDILYGMVVECDGVAVLESSAPLPFPPRFKQALLEERDALLEQERLDLEFAAEAEKELGGSAAVGAAAGPASGLATGSAAEPANGSAPGDASDEEAAPDASGDGDLGGEAGGAAAGPPTLNKFALMRYDFSNRELYWELLSLLLEPTPSVLHNSDGEPVSRQRLVFAVDSVPAAFAALGPLSVGTSQEDLLATARHAPDGALEAVGFSWIRGGSEGRHGAGAPVLGQIRIDGGRMTADVDSGERGKEFKRLVQELLGDRARYLMTEVR